MKTLKILGVIGIILFAFQNLSAQSKWKWENRSSTVKPTLTEINYVQGVTDTIQKQLNSKVSTADLVTPTEFDTLAITAKATAPTMPVGTSTTDVASTAFVQGEFASKVSTTAFLQKYGSTVKTASVIAGMYSVNSATLVDNTLLLYALEVQPTSIVCTSDIEFRYNATASPVQTSFSWSGISMSGVQYSSSPTIQPYSGLVLIKNIPNPTGTKKPAGANGIMWKTKSGLPIGGE